jgi:hypothetical protein
MADAMEMTILSILSPALHCDWWISSYEQALITTVVFCGMMLSSTMWGNICGSHLSAFSCSIRYDRRMFCRQIRQENSKRRV